MDDLQLHSHLIGQQGSRAALNTPVLVLDRDQLDANIAVMQTLAAAQGIALRPHGKTHKSINIARRQIARGAVGVCCAKIGEAEVFADGDIDGLLITSPVAAPAVAATEEQPRRRGRPRRDRSLDAPAAQDEGAPTAFDADRLPPSLGISATVAPAPTPAPAAEAAPAADASPEEKPRRRRVRAVPDEVQAG